MASNFYRDKDKPEYILGHALELGLAVVGLCAVMGHRMNYTRINRKRATLLQTSDVKETDMNNTGDRALTFRYVL